MRVAVAVITDKEQRVLITRRPLHASHGGFWEFPGGKLENEELATSALIREIKEEVGIEVKAYDYLGEVCHSYDSRFITLLIYHVYDYHGEAFRRESQIDLRWVNIENLKQFQFPAANMEIIELFKRKAIKCSRLM